MFEKQTWMRAAGDLPDRNDVWFEYLSRAVFSAGLGPKVVESRWLQMTLAFHGWGLGRVAGMREADVQRLLGDPAVIRNRRKIEATIENANRMINQLPDFSDWVKSLVARHGMEGAAQYLSELFANLGRTSALFFLFACGFRPADWTV